MSAPRALVRKRAIPSHVRCLANLERSRQKRAGKTASDRAFPSGAGSPTIDAGIQIILKCMTGHRELWLDLSLRIEEAGPTASASAARTCSATFGSFGLLDWPAVCSIQLPEPPGLL